MLDSVEGPGDGEGGGRNPEVKPGSLQEVGNGGQKVGPGCINKY